MSTPPYGCATAPWVRFCHILHSTHHSARSRRTRAVSDSTASSGRNSASSRLPALLLGCPFLSFSLAFRSRHQSLYLSSMVGYSSNPEIQICKSAKIHAEDLKWIGGSCKISHSCLPLGFYSPVHSQRFWRRTQPFSSLARNGHSLPSAVSDTTTEVCSSTNEGRSKFS